MSGEKPKRRLICVDVETTGLRPRDVCVEISWHDLTYDVGATFVPAHDIAWVLEHGQPDALELNGYRKRLLDAQQDRGVKVAELHHALRGQVLAGANPSFDAAHLSRLFDSYGLHAEPWHHRKLDLSAYAAGVLGLHPAELPGLAGVCELLGVTPGDHTAEADVRATVLALRALMAKAEVA